MNPQAQYTHVLKTYYLEELPKILSRILDRQGAYQFLLNDATKTLVQDAHILALGAACARMESELQDLCESHDLLATFEARPDTLTVVSSEELPPPEDCEEPWAGYVDVPIMARIRVLFTKSDVDKESADSLVGTAVDTTAAYKAGDFLGHIEHEIAFDAIDLMRKETMQLRRLDS